MMASFYGKQLGGNNNFCVVIVRIGVRQGQGGD